MICLCMLMTLSVIFIPVKALEFSNEFQNGCNCELDENYVPIEPDAVIRSISDSAVYSVARNDLPDAVDNSLSLCFPVIGDQGDKGACVCFSTAYYQFTYEKNLLNGTFARTEDGVAINENVASPDYIYNIVNHGEIDRGYRSDRCVEFLREHGCVSLADLPYDDSSSLATADVSAAREALGTRVSYVCDFEVGTGIDVYDVDEDGDTEESLTIVSPDSSSQLNMVKAALNEGRVLTVSMYAYDRYWDSRCAEGSDEIVIYQASSPTGGTNHSLTVVGYNDEIWCDINDDNIMQPAEQGAFKVVNSWGNWKNGGWVWVAYDALNAESAITDINAPSHGQRIPAFVDFTFSEDSTVNTFKAISVENYEPKLILELTADVTSTTNNVMLFRDHSINDDFDQKITSQVGVVLEQGSFMYTMFWDYEEICNPFEVYRSGYIWSFSSWSDCYNQVTSARIIDFFGNTIDEFEVEIEYTDNGVPLAYAGTTTIDLALGDLDYDGVLEVDDAVTLLYYTMGSVDLSYTQLGLADFDGNGIIDTADARDLYAVALQSSNNSNAMNFEVLHTMLANSISL